MISIEDRRKKKIFCKKRSNDIQNYIKQTTKRFGKHLLFL